MEEFFSRWGRRGTDAFDYVNERRWIVVVVLLFGGLVAWTLYGTEGSGLTAETLQATLDVLAAQPDPRIGVVAIELTDQPTVTDLTAIAPTLQVQGLTQVEQYAAAAFADFELDVLEWGAVQAAGPPNTEGCTGDTRTAYAPANPTGGSSTLTLNFAQLVRARGIFIYENFSPGFVTEVIFIDSFGAETVVYSAPGQVVTQCPFIRAIAFEDDDLVGNTLRLTVTPGGNVPPTQIDAVQLFGVRFQ